MPLPAADGSPCWRRGRKPKYLSDVLKPSQRNFTDPQSRIMKDSGGFVQACSAQAAMDAKAQVILAHHPAGAAATDYASR
jgi:microsomal dipeptidase-like Zn-dependent dipeptidase